MHFVFVYALSLVFVCLFNRNKNNSSNPKKRYELFLKATQLDIIIEKLDECQRDIEKARTSYRSHLKATQALEEKFTEIVKKVAQFQSMEPLKVRHKIC